jgi:predicted CopG family antitoxin
MATKTISIDLEAYERLKRARLSARDSFSQIIKRARWEQQTKSCGELLAASGALPVANARSLSYIETAQSMDAPPDNPWS